MPLKRTNIFHDSVPPEPGSNDLASSLYAMTTQNVTFGPVTPPKTVEHWCKWILYDDILDTRVRIWDLVILIPNGLFTLFLLVQFCVSFNRIQATNTPIFKTFYILVWLVSIVGIIRGVVSMAVYPAEQADKVLWLVLRFFLLSTELSIVIFGLAFGHLDSRTGVQKVLIVTSLIALAYSVTQGCLEFLEPDQQFHFKQNSDEYSLYGHGGMLFWVTSSLLLSVVYFVIVVLPHTKLKDRLNLPTKKSFYIYCLCNALLNVSQAVGSALVYYHRLDGMCVIDVTSFLYFTGFAPLVYLTFLRGFFKPARSSFQFSYKVQVDDSGVPEGGDAVSLPYQTPASQTHKSDCDPDASFDSTHLDASGVDVIIHTDGQYGSVGGPVTSQLPIEDSINPLYDLSVNSEYFGPKNM